MRRSKKRLHTVPHANQRILERFGLTELPNKRFEYICRQSCSRSLCNFIDTDIFFILRRQDNKIITFLTKEQAMNTFDLEEATNGED